MALTMVMEPDELHDKRQRLKLTQEQLAARLGVTVSAVSRWERGQRRIPEPVARLLRLLAETAPRRSRRPKRKG